MPLEGHHGLHARPEMSAPALSLTRVGNSLFSAVQQKDYSATVWLRKRDKLEQELGFQSALAAAAGLGRANGGPYGEISRSLPASQQKCIALFALVCCFAVLVALIFSAVDFWGEDEDGITEENCSKNCRIVLVENIPKDLSFYPNGTAYLPLFVGLNHLLDVAKRSVEIVSAHWALTSTEQESRPFSANQGQYLFQRLLGLKSRGVKLKVASDHTDSIELKSLSERNAEVRFVNMTALTRGQLHSSFWVVDRKHLYIGSASMDWRSLSKTKELGVLVYNCSCLALDLHRIFSFYWQLQYRDYIPSIWSKRVTALYSRDNALSLQLNDTGATTYASNSPELFCPKGRTRDVDAIHRVIQEAKRFIYISITDYLPLVNSSSRGPANTRYWSLIDEMLRDALVLRGVKVRLLISLGQQTHPLTVNFVTSLRSLCVQLANCFMEVKFFSAKERKDGTLQRINHNKFMVTDSAVYIGNLDWVGNEFNYNAGVGLVIKSERSYPEGGRSIVEQATAAFERDWYSRYAKSLESSKIPGASRPRNLYMPTVKTHTESKESWNTPL